MASALPLVAKAGTEDGVDMRSRGSGRGLNTIVEVVVVIVAVVGDVAVAVVAEGSRPNVGAVMAVVGDVGVAVDDAGGRAPHVPSRCHVPYWRDA